MQVLSEHAFMIRLGHQTRLTRKEVVRFTKITAIVPVDVRALADLEACRRVA